MWSRVGIFAVIGLVGVAVGAEAATVQNMQGSVLINRGTGFQAATGSAPVAVGDQVMVREGGSAQIVYDGGCAVKVEQERITAVKAEPPCGAFGGGSGGALGAGATPYVISGAIIVGGGALAYGLSQSSNKSASP